ncbi:MAG TPA: hypothetical protein VJ045_04160 [Hyphomicrobiaceae bacterium]|nr:hypothetical protein [Hyphomicrobiaceae bacterium]
MVQQLRREGVEAREEDHRGAANVSVRWYSNRDDRRELWALRYRAYLDSGLIEPSRGKIYSDAYDDLASTVTAGLFKGGSCIATLRLNFWSAHSTGPSLPCEQVYPEIDDIKAAAPGTLVELSRLAMDPAIKNTRYRARLYAALIRAAIAACIATDAKLLLVGTQLKWRRFYEHVFGFKEAAPPQLYPPGNVICALLSQTLGSAERRRLSRKAFFRMQADEIAGLRSTLGPMLSRRANNRQ